MPEFQRSTLEMIRQPLESGEVTISRVLSSLTYPAKFMLIGALNPCPCGYFGHPRKRCQCTPNQVQKYMGKISGPLLDRIDIHLEVPTVELERMRSARNGQSSQEMRDNVIQAREIQSRRFTKSGLTNGRMGSKLVKQHCRLDDSCEAILRNAVQELGLSARAHDKVLRVSRTIADLEKSESIQTHHLSEAIQYRRLDRAI
jgi:magnesium chelatase family protein